jgi:hypothetical protein
MLENVTGFHRRLTINWITEQQNPVDSFEAALTGSNLDCTIRYSEYFSQFPKYN